MWESVFEEVADKVFAGDERGNVAKGGGGGVLDHVGNVLFYWSGRGCDGGCNFWGI
jgi:hypothetical protein